MATSLKDPKKPRISLSGMPVIDLTQGRTATSGSQNGEVNGHSSARTNGGCGDGQISKYCKLVPRPDDEPPVICRLSGNSVSSYTELCGWTFLQPLKFFNIRSSTHFHTMTDGRGEVIKAAADLQAKCISLKEMEHLVGGNQLITCPVFVHVVAKRKVDVFGHNRRLLIIPLVVIADKSGYCVLCAFNEGLATIYNEVEVGDLLLVTRCIPQTPRRTYHRGLFSEDMFLNLELKLQFYTARNHYIWKFSPLRAAQFKMPLELFDAYSQAKLPSDLETEFQQPASLWINLQSENYYDLSGVITYVGRIERFQNVDTQDVQCLVNGEETVMKITRFVEYRWIYLMDQTSGQFPVKVYVNNATLPQQTALVPGAIVVLTHCQTKTCPYTGKYTETSHYTHLYLEGNIEKYYMLHPPNFREKTGELMVRQHYVSVMSRKEIILAIGGTHTPIITDQDKFLSFYAENRHKLFRNIPEEKPMLRRESRRIYFEGMIFRVLKVTDENDPVRYYFNKEKYTEEMIKKQETGEYEVIENFYSYTRHINTSWYAFQRKLPPYDPFILHQNRCRDMVKKIVAQYKPLCGPLLMPAEMPGYQEDGSPPEMATFERLDGPPYLLMDIVNPETHIWYTVIWKSRHFTVDEMLQKVDAAQEKKIICMAEVYCTEPDAPLEVNLLDFVIND